MDAPYILDMEYMASSNLCQPFFLFFALKYPAIVPRRPLFHPECDGKPHCLLFVQTVCGQSWPIVKPYVKHAVLAGKVGHVFCALSQSVITKSNSIMGIMAVAASKPLIIKAKLSQITRQSFSICIAQGRTVFSPFYAFGHLGGKNMQVGKPHSLQLVFGSSLRISMTLGWGAASYRGSILSRFSQAELISRISHSMILAASLSS